MDADRLLVFGIAAALVLLALAGMAGLHERHYRARRSAIGDARLRGLELRLQTLERILGEDRLT